MMNEYDDDDDRQNFEYDRVIELYSNNSIIITTIIITIAIIIITIIIIILTRVDVTSN